MDKLIVEATSECTVDSLREKMLAAFSATKNVQLYISGFVYFDIWLVQIIEAARHEAALVKGTFTLTAPVPPALVAVLRRGGFLKESAGSDDLFWLNGETTR